MSSIRNMQHTPEPTKIKIILKPYKDKVIYYHMGQ